MGFKKRKLSLVLRVKASKPQSSTLPKNGASTSAKPRRGVPKKLTVGGTPAHDYDPLYFDSSDEEDQMEDIQSPSPLHKPAGATSASVAPPDSVLARCFNELLKARDEVSWPTMCLDLVFSNVNPRQIAALNKFANPNDLIHEASVHHLSVLTVEG